MPYKKGFSRLKQKRFNALKATKQQLHNKLEKLKEKKVFRKCFLGICCCCCRRRCFSWKYICHNYIYSTKYLVNNVQLITAKVESMQFLTISHLCCEQKYGKCTSSTLTRAVTRTLIGGGGVYSYIRVLPDWLLLKSISFQKKLVGQNQNILIYTPPPQLSL